MRCPFCKAKVEEGDIFCMSCERDLPTDDQPAQVAVAPVVTNTPEAAAGEDGASSEGAIEEPLDQAHGWVQPAVRPRLLRADSAQFPVTVCPNPQCRAPADKFEADGTCGNCFKQAVNSLRDDFYLTVVDPSTGVVMDKVAARSHLGKKHLRNEDFVCIGASFIGTRRISFMVVCDGVSQCTNPQEASSEACKAAGEVLRKAALEDRMGSETLLKEAIDAAQTAVCKVKPEPNARRDYGSPACTITATYVRDGEVFYGWCGDSRIYTIDLVDGDLKTRLLTRDHTYLNWVLSLIESRKDQCSMAAAAALITGNDVERAEKYLGLKYQAALTAGDSTQLELLEQDVIVEDGVGGIVHIKVSSLHTMEQCLGEVPEGCEFTPSFGRITLEHSQGIFACSDGAWNDADPMDGADTSEFTDMFTASGGDALQFACATVDFASGVDNNTCAVILV